MDKKDEKDVSLKDDTTGLGLSGKDFSNIPDWEFYDYPTQEGYAQYKEQWKSYEVDLDEDE